MYYITLVITDPPQQPQRPVQREQDQVDNGDERDVPGDNNQVISTPVGTSNTKPSGRVFKFYPNQSVVYKVSHTSTDQYTPRHVY